MRLILLHFQEDDLTRITIFYSRKANYFLKQKRYFDMIIRHALNCFKINDKGERG